jgi:hypothetical protein
VRKTFARALADASRDLGPAGAKRLCKQLGSPFTPNEDLAMLKRGGDRAAIDDRAHGRDRRET